LWTRHQSNCMAIQDPVRESDTPDDRGSEGYVSPTVDFLLLFALAAVVALLAASVLVP
jgi:hypothetical protein